MKTKSFLLLFLLSAATVSARAEAVTARTDPFRVDLRPSPRVVQPGATETLAYSTRWDGGDAAAIALDGELFGSYAGEGAAAWTPSAPGLYSFTHAATSNGVAIGETLTASFLVEGAGASDLTILATSDLKEGTGIALGGVPAGWTLHYTTDGSAPTAVSPEYTGPFTLPQSATVKVVAVSPGGFVSDVAERRFDLAPPLAVTGAQARQRYPWNGLVDVDFTLEGDPVCTYRVALVARDVDGGTNLAVRTVWEDRGAVTNDAVDLRPGVHRLVWNAAADLPEGFAADRVAIGVRADSVQDTALYMVVDLSGGPNAEHYPVSYLPDVPEGGWTDEYKTDKLVLRRIEPGWFTMGSPEDEEGRFPENEFLHDVSLTKPLMASIFETTQRQFELVQGTNCASFIGLTRPEDNVPLSIIRGAGEEFDWPSVRSTAPDSFVGRLSRKACLAAIDLPTEAQWEYVCRAGTRSALNNGREGEAELAQLGRFGDGATGANGGYVPVGGYLPNAWNVYDMHGNVYERCLDWFEDRPSGIVDPVGPASGEYRVKKGGSWYSLYRFGRSAFRQSLGSTGSNSHPGVGGGHHDVGLRLFLHDAPAVVESPIVAPAGLTATSNRVSDITLSWQPVAGAYAYQIRRSKTGAFEDGTWLNTVTNTTYADWTAESRTNYTYWVRAQFESGRVGVWSEAASGWRHAKYLSIDLSGGANASSYPMEWFDQEPADGWTAEWKTTKLVLRGIDAGMFLMGSPEDELGRELDGWDETQHPVTLTDAFYLGVFPTTQKQYTLVSGSNPSKYTGNTRPVESVAWNDLRGVSANWPTIVDPLASSWLGRLRARTGAAFDLPTEAQWEYACRAGTTTALYSGKNLTVAEGSDPNLDPIAYYTKSAPDPATTRHAVVGTKLPNDWGLYDMLGNVWDFCLDWYAPYGPSASENPVGPATGTYRIVRGGSYWSPAYKCRSANRAANIQPSTTSAMIGFRICLTME